MYELVVRHFLEIDHGGPLALEGLETFAPVVERLLRERLDKDFARRLRILEQRQGIGKARILRGLGPADMRKGILDQAGRA